MRSQRRSFSLALHGVPKTPTQSLGIGVFDGLHRGHQAILEKVDTLLTFTPHPDLVLGKNSQLKSLSTIAELRHYIKRLVTLRFTPEVAAIEAHTFLDEVIGQRLKPKTIVVGYDFRFGKGKDGTLELLQSWASKRKISVLQIPPILSASGQPIKSSTIRSQLETNFKEAVSLLGHSYLIVGTVIAGEKRGRRLGFPTANLAVPDQKLVPGAGVYAGAARLGRQVFKAMIYIGNKPSFGGKNRGIEVHLLQYEGPEFYDHRLQVFLEKKIRPEQKFSSAEQLIAQIKHDIQIAEATL